MKNIIVIIVLTLCFAGCKYPESDIRSISVNVNGVYNKKTQTVTLRAQVSNPENAVITEQGFCYAGFGNFERESYPTVGLNKHIVNGADFVWILSEEELHGGIAYIRAYVVVEGIVIYSAETIEMSLSLLGIMADLPTPPISPAPPLSS